MLFLLFILGFQTPLPANEIQALQSLASQVSARRGQWTGFRAEVKLHFLKNNEQAGACRGQMAYQRLEESILLHCFDAKNRLLFSFHTSDTSFQLYLPSHQAVYTGSIFDLESAAAIESHLNPLDLYRALKPMTFDVRTAQIEKENAGEITLRVFAKKKGLSRLSRKITLNRWRDMTEEIYYATDGQPDVGLRRLSFSNFPLGKEKGRTVPYPEKIVIESQREPKATVLFFEQVSFYPAMMLPDAIQNLPEGTRQIPIGQNPQISA